MDVILGVVGILAILWGYTHLDSVPTQGFSPIGALVIGFAVLLAALMVASGRKAKS